MNEDLSLNEATRFGCNNEQVSKRFGYIIQFEIIILQFYYSIFLHNILNSDFIKIEIGIKILKYNFNSMSQGDPYTIFLC